LLCYASKQIKQNREDFSKVQTFFIIGIICLFQQSFSTLYDMLRQSFLLHLYQMIQSHRMFTFFSPETTAELATSSHIWIFISGTVMSRPNQYACTYSQLDSPRLNLRMGYILIATLASSQQKSCQNKLMTLP